MHTAYSTIVHDTEAETGSELTIVVWMMSPPGIRCQHRAELLTFLQFRPAAVPPPHIPVFPLLFLPDNPGVNAPHPLVLLLRLGLVL